MAAKTVVVTALLVVARDGRIRFASDRARKSLCYYFGSDRPATRLPPALRSWLAKPMGKRGQCLPFLIKKGDAQLVITTVLGRGESECCLLFEQWHAAAVPPRLRARGLTAKETEVLHCLMCGKSNAQIGTMLGQKTNTVAKHLHEVYDKMGVDNRSGAIAFARHLAVEA